MRALYLIFLCSILQLGTAQVVLDVKADGGASGDGITDDTEAIQQTIDMVGALGGGTVYFPPGVYIVSPVPDTDPFQVICLNLVDDLQLEGAGEDQSIIRLAPGAGNYDAMIGHRPSFEPVDHITLSNLQLDANADQNEVPSEAILTTQGGRNIFRIFLGQDYLIEDCHFTNSKGVWNIVFNGITEQVVIRNNLFDAIGDEAEDWDHSTIYMNGADFLVENNEFYSRFGAGTLGARTAIETHGNNQIVRNNYIKGYVYGANITGYSNFYISRNQFIYGNTFDEVAEGLVLWSGLLDDPDFANGLDNIKIFENQINLTTSGWEDWTFFNGGGGIVFWTNDDRDIDSLFVFKNTINFTGNPLSGADDSRRSSGIRAGTNINPTGMQLKHTYWMYNEIINSDGPGIYLERPSDFCVIANNRIINAGNSTGELFDGFRSGIFLNDTTSNIQISCNEVLEDNPTGNTSVLIYQNGHNNGNAFHFENTSNIPNLPELNYGSDSSGPLWDQEPAQPSVFFATDSIRVSSGSTENIALMLTTPSDEPIEVTLFTIDRNDRYGIDWATNTTVVFEPGETSKLLPISNFLSSDAASEVHFLQVLMGTDYKLGCIALLTIVLDNTVVEVNEPSSHDIGTLSIFPNPAKGSVQISGNTDRYRIQLWSIDGRLYHTWPNVSIPNELGLVHFKAGIYWIAALNLDTQAQVWSKLILR